jgi:hypothetical protein
MFGRKSKIELDLEEIRANLRLANNHISDLKKALSRERRERMRADAILESKFKDRK